MHRICFHFFIRYRWTWRTCCVVFDRISNENVEPMDTHTHTHTHTHKKLFESTTEWGLKRWNADDADLVAGGRGRRRAAVADRLQRGQRRDPIAGAPARPAAAQSRRPHHLPATPARSPPRPPPAVSRWLKRKHTKKKSIVDVSCLKISDQTKDPVTITFKGSHFIE